MAWFTRTIGASTAALCLAGATVGPASAGPPTWDPATDPHCKIETYVVPTAKSTSRGGPIPGKDVLSDADAPGPPIATTKLSPQAWANVPGIEVYLIDQYTFYRCDVG